VPLNVTQHWSKHDFVLIDTSHILFICAGTFTDLYDYATTATLGFDAAARGDGRRKRPSLRDLQEYGMLAEFLARIPVAVTLDPLDEDALVRVLTEPEDSLVAEYQTLFELERVDLRFEPDALREIAARARTHRLGARSLRAILEAVLHDDLFRAPEIAGETITVTRDVVRQRLEAAAGDGVI